MFRKITLLLAAAFFVLQPSLQSQVVWADPVFPTENDPVTIYFDAAQGSGGLEGCNCDVYLHTGVITSASTGPSDWKYVPTTWGQADPDWKMTPVAGQPDVYSYQIQPSIKQYYGVPGTTEEILKMAFVFRNANGSLEGKDVGGADLYYDVYPENAGFNMTLIAPNSPTVFTSLGAVVDIQAAATQQADFQVFDNGAQVHAATGTSLNYALTVTAGGAHLVEVKATSGAEEVVKSFTYVVPQAPTVEALPAGTELGINDLSGTAVRLALFAPNKQFVYVIGDFNDWQFDDAYQMKRTPDGTTWWLDITGLTAGQFYAFQYVVDGSIRTGDPYSKLVLDPSNDGFIPAATFPNIPPYPTGKTTGIASLMQPGAPAYPWQVTDFQRPVQENLVIYELLMRDFTHQKNFQTVLDTLDYFQRLGVTAIEFMPINEFDGNQSWGYNPTYHYALDKYYGTPDAFKALVDACHERGIAVIVDVVFNHAHERNPLCMLYWDNANFRPAADNPWLNPEPKHDFNVFFDFNHESQATKTYVRKTLQHWLQEYRVDGFRFDLSKGLTQNTNGPWDAGAYDAARIATLKDYADAIWAASPGAYVILEHFTANTEEEELSDYGAMLWGGAGIQNQFLEAAMGYTSNFSSASYKTKGWDDAHLIAYMESHDEERMMYKNLQYGNSDPATGYNVKDLATALERTELTNVLYYAIPGPKMLWQFGEMGYDFSINRCVNGSVNPDCRLDPKPIRWDYMANPDRVELYNTIRSMTYLRNHFDVFQTDDFQLVTSTFQKVVKLNSTDMNVVVLGNFDVKTGNVTPNFQHTGKWYEYFTGDSLDVADVAAPISFDAGEYRLYTDVAVVPPVAYTSSRENARPTLDWSLSPNPASSELTVRFSLSKNAEVALSVYDLSGRQVSVPFEGTAMAGQHEVTVGLGLPSGFYFVNLMADGAVHCQKLVVN